MPAAPKVFISYSHDGDAHKARVLALADRLRHAGGIEAIIDQYVQFPPEGWPLWCEKQIDRADFVLMVCTEVYLRRVRNEEIPATGLGVLWEAQLIRQELYDSGSVSTKFVPVRFADGSDAHIPRPVRRFSRYVVDTADGYEALYRYLTNQPATPPPQIGEREMLAPAARPGRGELEEVIRIRKEDVLPVFVHLGDKRELLMGRWWLASHLLRRRSPGDDREADNCSAWHSPMRSGCGCRKRRRSRRSCKSMACAATDPRPPAGEGGDPRVRAGPARGEPGEGSRSGHRCAKARAPRRPHPPAAGAPGPSLCRSRGRGTLSCVNPSAARAGEGFTLRPPPDFPLPSGEGWGEG